MAQTKYLFLKGKASWVRAHQLDRFEKWSFQFHPDSQALEVIRDLQAEGLKNILKKDDDGYFIVLSRPKQKMIRGKVVGFAPPEVIDREGKPLLVPVGNGSDVTAKIEVYPFSVPGGSKGVAARWASLRVDNLVPFEKESFTEQEEKLVRNLPEQPEPLF